MWAGPQRIPRTQCVHAPCIRFETGRLSCEDADVGADADATDADADADVPLQLQ